MFCESCISLILKLRLAIRINAGNTDKKNCDSKRCFGVTSETRYGTCVDSKFFWRSVCVRRAMGVLVDVLSRLTPRLALSSVRVSVLQCSCEYYHYCYYHCYYWHCCFCCSFSSSLSFSFKAPLVLMYAYMLPLKLLQQWE